MIRPTVVIRRAWPRPKAAVEVVSSAHTQEHLRIGSKQRKDSQPEQQRRGLPAAPSPPPTGSPRMTNTSRLTSRPMVQRRDDQRRGNPTAVIASAERQSPPVRDQYPDRARDRQVHPGGDQPEQRHHRLLSSRIAGTGRWRPVRQKGDRADLGREVAEHRIHQGADDQGCWWNRPQQQQQRVVEGGQSVAGAAGRRVVHLGARRPGPASRRRAKSELPSARGDLSRNTLPSSAFGLGGGPAQGLSGDAGRQRPGPRVGRRRHRRAPAAPGRSADCANVAAQKIGGMANCPYALPVSSWAGGIRLPTTPAGRTSIVPSWRSAGR